jgi:hypothetical protein
MATQAQILTILNILVALHLSRALYKSTLFMRNKPNLCVFWAVNGDCEEKQTQTNPIQSQNKAIFCTKNPPQSQNKPNQTQFQAGHAAPLPKAGHAIALPKAGHAIQNRLLNYEIQQGRKI